MLHCIMLPFIYPRDETVLLRVLMVDAVGLIEVYTRNYKLREYG